MESKQQEAFQPNLLQAYTAVATPDSNQGDLHEPLQFRETTLPRTAVTVMRLGYSEQKQMLPLLAPHYARGLSAPLDMVISPYHPGLEGCNVNSGEIRASVISQGMQVVLFNVDFSTNGQFFRKRKDMVPYHAVYSCSSDVSTKNIEVTNSFWPVSEISYVYNDGGKSEAKFSATENLRPYKRVMSYRDYQAEIIAIRANALIEAHINGNLFRNTGFSGDYDIIDDQMSIRLTHIPIGYQCRKENVRMQPALYRIDYDSADRGKAVQILNSGFTGSHIPFHCIAQ